MMTNGDGLIAPKDLRIAMEKYGGYKPKRQIVYSIFSEFDKDSSGEIEFREFLSMMTSKPCEKDTPEDFAKCFHEIAQESKDFITVNDLI